MKRAVVFLTFLAPGCSTAPVADLLDALKPGRMDPGAPAYGGVGAQGTGPAVPGVEAPVAVPR